MTDCKTCWGYGLRADCGAPIGALAVQDDVPTLRCPECGANGNPHLHAKVSVAAMERGKHVLIEKPITTTLDEADALGDVAVGMEVGAGFLGELLRVAPHLPDGFGLRLFHGDLHGELSRVARECRYGRVERGSVALSVDRR